MIQILPPNYRKSFAEQLAGGLEAAQTGIQSYRREKMQNQSLEKAGFGDLIGLPPELQKAALIEKLKSERGLNPLQQTQQELANARLQQTKSQQNFFDRSTGQTNDPQIESLNSTQSPQRNPLTNMSEENLRQLSAFAGQPGEQGIIGNMAKAQLEKTQNEKKSKRKFFQEERSYHAGYSKDLEKEANILRESLPKKEMALNLARNSVETGNVSYFSPDRLADALGPKGDLFRTAKGAQLITAGKENLLSNMSRVSSKAQNQWFEQRLNSMFPKIGQSKEANLTVQEMLEGEAFLDRIYLNEFDRLSEEDEKNYGVVQKDISKRVHSSLKPLENEILKRTSYRLKEIEENEKGLTGLKSQVGKNVIRGTPLTLAMAKLYKQKFGENALNVAEKNGYYIPSIEEFRIFQERPQEFREELQ